MDTERISKNEERLDKMSLCIKNLEKALEDFKVCRKELACLNRYYGSKAWFKDKEDFEKEEKHSIKAGVLGEDSVWNLNDDIDELLKDMKKIVKGYNKK